MFTFLAETELYFYCKTNDSPQTQYSQIYDDNKQDNHFGWYIFDDIKIGTEN